MFSQGAAKPPLAARQPQAHSDLGAVRLRQGLEDVSHRSGIGVTPLKGGVCVSIVGCLTENWPDRGGLRYPCRFACEPSFYLPPRIANRFGTFEYARISHQPQESEQANPRETDRTGAVQLLIEPVAC